MDYIEASNYKQWKKFNLLDYADYADYVTFCNQTEYGDGQLSGDWYYVDDEKRVVYVGSFGNDNAPGATHYTSAEVFMGDEDLTGEMTYAERVAELEAMPEYAPTDDDDDEEEEDADTGGAVEPVVPAGPVNEWTDSAILAFVNDVPQFFSDRAREDAAEGDLFGGWDWPTMRVVHPELCALYDAAKAEGLRRVEATGAFNGVAYVKTEKGWKPKESQENT